MDELKIRVLPDEAPPPLAPLEPEGITISVKTEEPLLRIKIEEPVKVYLNLRRHLNGDYIIRQHPLFDIVIMPKKNKIVTFIRNDARIDPYPLQDKFFNYLRYKGIAQPETVQSGNVYGSLEASYAVNDEIDTLEVILYAIYNFLKDEVPELDAALEYDYELDSMYTEPSEEDSTELGEVPHKEKKGGIDPGLKPYGLIYRL